MRYNQKRFTTYHSPLVAIFSLILSVFLVAGWQPKFDFLIGCSLFSVLLIGLPHGALDHKVGAKVFLRIFRIQSLLRPLLIYLVISSLVIAGWYISPRATILLFFGLSAWHFGLEEAAPDSSTFLHRLASFAKGGMIIWLPCYFQGEAVTDLLKTTMPLGAYHEAEYIVQSIGFLFPLFSLLAFYDLLKIHFDGERASQRRFFRIAFSWNEIFRTLSFALLFALANPLISFTVYFCGWHSIRGLVDLYEDYGKSLRQFVWQLTPITSAAIILFLGGWTAWSLEMGLADAAVRIVFIGLSAVAIPHLILHVFDHVTSSEQVQTTPFNLNKVTQ